MCVSTVLSSLKNNQRHSNRMGIEPTTFVILEQMSNQLDHRDCPVAVPAAGNKGFKLPLAAGQSRWSSW